MSIHVFKYLEMRNIQIYIKYIKYFGLLHCEYLKTDLSPLIATLHLSVFHSLSV